MPREAAPGDVYFLRGWPALILTIRARFPDGVCRGTLTVVGVGVVGTIKVKYDIDRLWVRRDDR